MNEENELKRMFEAQRKVDEGLAPSFDDIQAKSHAARDWAAVPAGRQSRSVAVVVAVATLTLTVVSLVSWINFPRSNAPIVPSTSDTDLRRINEICDSLLVTINKTDQAVTDERVPDQEMAWPTGTDSLIPFETLIFNVRTSP